MGLDITAYSRVTRLTDSGDALGDDTVTLYDNPHFPGRIAPQRSGEYVYGDSYEVLSMGYGSYNHWREWLAKLAGYPALNNVTPHSKGAWEATEGPFWELIHFADNEGTIGTDACKKLLKDFNEFEQKAVDNSTGPEFDHYVDMHNGLRLAAIGGCLTFS